MRALLITLLLAAPATAGPGVLVKKIPDAGQAPTLAVARLTAAMDMPLIPQAVVDDLVRFETSSRDLVHGAMDQLVALADDLPAPDLTILTTAPIPDLTTEQSSGFGWREDPINHSTRWHSGTDFHAQYGTPVVSAGDGVVVFAQWQGGYGNVVYVDHGGGVTTRYAHLSRILVKKDATITAGQLVGRVGATGRATGPHLHFEVRLDGAPVSPVLAMNVAELQRDHADIARLATFALRPELQAHALATDDRPRGVVPKPEGRPERSGRVHQEKPLW